MVFRNRRMSSPTHDVNDTVSTLIMAYATKPMHEELESDSGDDYIWDSCSSDGDGSWDSDPPPSSISPIYVPQRNAATKSSACPPVVVTESPPPSQPQFFLIGIILIGLIAVYLSRSSVNFAADQVAIMAANRDRLAERLKSAEGELKTLKREMSAMDELIHQQQAIDTRSSSADAGKKLALNELNALQGRLKQLSTSGDSLKEHVQKISREEILAKYGAGVQHVELELVFPDDHAGPTKFVVELATEEMPHSAFTFLEMVSTGLLDGCSFILNALHVLKAAPLPYDGTSAAAKAKAFTEHGLESVAFKEYSDAFPHKRYTLGFAADGSPSFYINTEDNTDIHMGDPCFGKIIEGFDTIRRLEASPTRNGIWYAKRIGIKHAKVLRWARRGDGESRPGLRRHSER